MAARDTAPGTARTMPGAEGIELRHLRYFTTVAQLGTITAAARQLRVAQPSLSQQIRALERRVGVALFQRTATGTRLTPAGQVLRDRVRDMFDLLPTAIAEARQAPRQVRVGVCPGTPADLLARVEATLAGQPPDGPDGPALDIVFEPADSAQQVRLLGRGELQLGILHRPADPDGLAFAVLSEHDLGAVVAADNPLARKSTVDWSELGGYRLLWFPASRAADYETGIRHHLRGHGWNPRIVRQDQLSHPLFVHTLRSRPDLVALRPRSAATTPDLAWIPIRTDPPRERLDLAAVDTGPWHWVLDNLARAGRPE